MYAKQIAVMKGQAWNVVETLKTPDLGPLELTRRARVCVWDDIVEIPIAVPLRAPSAEMRRKQQPQPGRQPRVEEEHEEMDITAIPTPSQKPQPDLLSNSPPLDAARENRFNLSRDSSSLDIRRPDPAPAASATVKEPRWNSQSLGKQANGRPMQRSRMSYDTPRHNVRESKHHRRLSLSNRRDLDDDGFDDEGDLGYAANEDMEGNQKKVIVERLEMVKGRNPVFTWC
jgi:hypothetical protein